MAPVLCGACFERANNSLNQGSADTQRLADFQQAHAVLVEAQYALLKLGPCHAPAFLVGAPRAILTIAAAQPYALCFGSRH